MKEVPLLLPVQVFLDCFHGGLYPDLETVAEAGGGQPFLGRARR